MHTSPGATKCPRLRKRQIIARACQWALMAVAAAVLLTACSATRIAYNQAPTVAYWWIDGYVDLDNGQSTQLRGDIDRFFAWHRGTELPLYAQQLVRWQTLALKDISAEQACTEFEVPRSAYLRALGRSLEPLTALALRLSPDQLQHMQQRQKKGNQDFEEKYLSGDPAARLQDRLERYIDRYETLYGNLTEAQKRLLRTSLQHSSFDPRSSLAERTRRQEALLRAIRQLQATQDAGTSNRRPAPAQAVAALGDWSRELLQSPTPGYTDYLERQIREGCVQFATLHNSTSPEQRAHAVQLLQRYEEDLRALSAQD